MISRLLQRHFWIPAFVAIAAGFWLPGNYQGWAWSIPWQLGGILFCSCLKVRFTELRQREQRSQLVWRVTWLTMLKLLMFPIIVWLIVRQLAPDWAAGIALLAMMPAGMTSLAFTDVHAGNRLLALLLLVATSLLSPLTVPLLIGVVAPSVGGNIWLEMIVRAGYIVLLLATPFCAAQIIRRFASGFIDKHPGWWTNGAMMFSILLAFTACAAKRDLWQQWSAMELIMPLMLTALVSVVISMGCWLASRRLSRGDAIAFTCGALFLNNGLSVAIGAQFFSDDPRMVLPGVLNGIWMWAGMALLGVALRRQKNHTHEVP